DQNNTGRTPLMLAVQCNNEEAVDYLINNGAHISITDYSGNNLFYYTMQ
ncbi:ankyrin repeat domain-containing protein, partial [Butyrivibrio fibrisolvens]